MLVYYCNAGSHCRRSRCFWSPELPASNHASVEGRFPKRGVRATLQIPVGDMEGEGGKPTQLLPVIAVSLLAFFNASAKRDLHIPDNLHWPSSRVRTGNRGVKAEEIVV